MSDEVLEAFVKQYIESQHLPEVEFVWQGGEPALAGLDFYKKAVALQRKYQGNKTIINSFQTNGTILNYEWCRFFAHHDFLIGLSIDGPEKLHNQNRRFKKGAGTFRQVMNAVGLLRKNNVRFNTLTTVNSENVNYPVEVYNFLKSMGSQYMQFLPIVEQEAQADVSLKLISPAYEGLANITSWSVEPLAYGKFLSGVFDQWVKKDVGRHFVQIFDSTLANWINVAPALCVFQKTCGEAAVIESNGDLYSCDHFVYPENYLGNILETHMNDLMKSKQQINFGFAKETMLPEKCHNCGFKHICNGGCPKNRTVKTMEVEKNLNYLCEGYQYFYNHVEPYMNFMANELRNQRSPANVMNFE